MLAAAVSGSLLRHSRRYGSARLRMWVIHRHVIMSHDHVHDVGQTLTPITCREGRRLSTSTPVSSSADVTSHYADVNGVRIHYEKAGKGSHSLLLLPGALGSTRTDFGPQLEKLSRNKFTVYAFDPRGYGQSIPPQRDWPLDYFRRDADDAVAFMKSLNQGRVSVLGWSDGGMTGIVMAARYPDLVRRLVVWGANSYITPADMALYRQIEDVSKWSDRMREPFVKLYGMDYFQTQWRNWIGSVANFVEKRNGDICTEEVKQVHCPTLIVHGQKDPLVLQEHPDFLHANIAGSRLVNWSEAKHNLHLRYADDFNALVEDFLDGED